ncbi:MAG TPA: hypothetical protein PLV61_16750 [Parvularculaceae bacterium]|nr:hypothetical protein [Amphiplicatus sp.]HPE32846.1 hypothetical protein [Parvularculaceae bacterium]
MGAELLKKRQKSYAKHIDKNRATLGAPDLFNKIPTNQPRSAIAALEKDCSVAVGDKLIVEAVGGKLTLRRNSDQLGVFENPPADVQTKITAGGGVALGTVLQVHPISGTAEVDFK